MENFTFNNISLFIIFFLPGFISTKVYDLLISTDRRDFSKSLFEVIGFSTINFALLSWLIYLNIVNTFWTTYPILFILSVIIIFFIFPSILPIIYLKIIQTKYFSKFIISSLHKPWDFIFSKRQAFWVIINLKNGIKIGGKYDENSFSSSYPSKEQIYLEEVWKLDSEGVFLGPIERSKGIIILGDDISSIEFFQ